MKIFEVVLQDGKSKEKKQYNVEAREFASAASEAYLKRHTLSRGNDSDWHIVSLSERGWKILDLTNK